MKLILLATTSGKELYIKTDLDTDLALLRFKLETQESVRDYNDVYHGDANEAPHYDYLYLSTEVVENDYDDDYDSYDYEHCDDEYDYYASDFFDHDDVPEPIPCPCCGGSGHM